MIRNIKALGLAFAAVFAMSAVMAAGAQAAKFTASAYPANGSGGQTTEHIFHVQGQTVKCKTATFKGTLNAASSEITITPHYTECTAFGFIGATIDMNSCDFLFTTDAVSTTVGTVHVLCSKANDSITITAGGCVVHIPPQTPTVNKVEYKNQSGGVLVTSKAEGIHSNVTSGFGCTLASKETDTTGAYTGSTQFNAQTGVTVDVG